MKWKAPRAATTTDTGSQPTRVSRRGGHLVIDGLTAQMHGGLPTSVLPTKPLSRSNDPTNTTGQQAHPVFHTRSLFSLLCAQRVAEARRPWVLGGRSPRGWATAGCRPLRAVPRARGDL